MRTWFEKPWSDKIKFPKTLFGTNLNPSIIDILVLLSRFKGEVESLNFIDQYFFLVQVIYSNTQYIDWAYEVRKILSNALHATKFYNTFNMSSFLIYMLVSLKLKPSLPWVENFLDDVKSYEFYPCLQLENSYAAYMS